MYGNLSLPSARCKDREFIVQPDLQSGCSINHLALKTQYLLAIRSVYGSMETCLIFLSFRHGYY